MPPKLERPTGENRESQGTGAAMHEQRFSQGLVVGERN